MEARLRAVELAGKFVGVHEKNGQNDGEIVEMFQRADTLPGERYAWCQAFQNSMWRLATGGKVQEVNGRKEIRGGKLLANGTASVPMFRSWAYAHSLIRSRPLRGDHVLFDFDGDGTYDHVGIVVKVLRVLPGAYYLRTREGNTAPEGGNQSEGDGVYEKTRIVRARNTTFVRVPGMAVMPPKAEYITRFALFVGRPGKRRKIGLYGPVALGKAVLRQALAMKDGESIRIDKRKVRVK